MKRSGQLKRSELKRTPLRRAAKKTGWVKGCYRATDLEWDELRRRKQRGCRVCGLVNGTSLHHLLGGAWRSDEADNLIPLCGSGTTGCHGIYTSRMTGASGDGVRRTWEEVADRIRRSLAPSEIMYVTQRVGVPGLERRYPMINKGNPHEH